MGNQDELTQARNLGLGRRLNRRHLIMSGLALGALAAIGGCGDDDSDDPEPTETMDSAGSSESADSTEAQGSTEPATASDEATATSEDSEGTSASTETSESTATEAPTTDASTPSESQNTTGFPKTITHALGETEIPALPERIVSVKDTEPLDCLLAIGLKPILYGYTDGYQLGRLSSWVQEIGIDEVERFDNLERSEPDVELIAAANPDLILDVWTPEEVYDQLSGVAPTLVLKNTDNEPWQNVQRLVGTATGREDEAEQTISETEAVIAEQAARVESLAGTTVTIAYEFFGELLINGAEVAIGRLVEQLGLTVQAPDPANITFLSLEQWQTVQDADIILTPEFIADDLVKQESNPLFLSLPQVKSGHYIVLPAEVSQSLYLESTLSVRWGVPKLADALIAAAEGQGKKIG